MPGRLNTGVTSEAPLAAVAGPKDQDPPLLVTVCETAGASALVKVTAAPTVMVTAAGVGPLPASVTVAPVGAAAAGPAPADSSRPVPARATSSNPVVMLVREWVTRR